MHFGRYSLLILLMILLLTACQQAEVLHDDGGEWVALKNTPTPQVPTRTVSAPTGAPTTAPTPTTASCTENKGSLTQQEISVAGYSAPLHFNLYLPPCYLENMPEDGYPLLILLHGQTYTDQQWLDIGLVDSMDGLIAAEEIPAFVVAMPYESTELSYNFNYVLTRTLLPWLEENERVCTLFQCRAIGGISRGGGWALYTAMQEPGLFSSLGLHSTPTFEDSRAHTQWALNAMPNDQIPRIFMDIGSDDYWFNHANALHVLLDDLGIVHEWHENEGDHNNEYWQTHLGDYLRWYGTGWQESIP